MSIRSATADDLADAESCVRDAYTLYLPRMDRPPAPMTADYVAHIERGHVSLLEEDGEVAGILVAFPRSDDYFVENVAVRPSHEGYGHGRALLEHAAQLARQAAALHECRDDGEPGAVRAPGLDGDGSRARGGVPSGVFREAGGVGVRRLGGGA